jgi:putative acetyltransferase
MRNGIEIRESLLTDNEALEELYPAAFPDEDLLPLVSELLQEEDGILSLVANYDKTVVGHVVFTMCSIAGSNERVALLGPVAVSPQFQRRGIGSALIQEGLNRLKSESATQVHVLGDPAYYGRFGFESNGKVTPPYPLPQEWLTAWQSISLLEAGPDMHGVLSVPRPWQRPALWAP